MYQDTSKKVIPRQPICLTDSDYDHILEEIGHRELFCLKEMWKFIVTKRKSNTSILNDNYMFLSYIHILAII